MAGFLIWRYISFGRVTKRISTAYFSTSSQILIKWRFEEGIEPNPNRYGKLTNLPDYSFVDGRPVPLGMNLYKRIKLQESYCKKIVELSGEIDFAIERYNKMKEEAIQEKQNMIESKLKPKGTKLLEKKSMK